jgi:hypothetical protein
VGLNFGFGPVSDRQQSSIVHGDLPELAEVADGR